MEEVPDADAGNAITIVDTPPSARHKQPAPPTQPVNVFDFLVTGDTPNATPNASKVSLGGSNEGMKMVEHAPKIFTGGGQQGHEDQAIYDEYEDTYVQHGYTYGEDPVPVKERPRIEYRTPGPKSRHHENQESSYHLDDSQKKSTDKKRKRVHVEELDLTAARQPSQSSDAPDADMTDAPPAILHSGLTGGLNRLLSNPKFPPSPPDDSFNDGLTSPSSPAKRSKHPPSTLKEKTKEKDRNGSLARGRNGALVKVRKRRSSDESRPRKHHRSHHSPDEQARQHKHNDRPPKPQKAIEDNRPKRKAIEYHSHSHSHNAEDTSHQQQQLVIFKTRAELFMSFVTKGPESQQGYSVHKALKRYHRERGELGLGLEKGDEEKELFKNLRLKRNERGEVVVFFSG